MNRLRVAIVGCGAIAEGIHVPMAALSDRVEVAALVEKSLPRARRLAAKYGVPVVVDDYRELIGQVDAAIVSLPNHLHAPVTIDLLQHGIHVLVEKPMALKTSECDEMIRAASDSGVILAVGLISRFFASSHLVKLFIEDELLGDILSFDLRRGNVYNWSVASDFIFRKEMAGGGVLTDIGVHSLDLLLWWLGDLDRVEYYDDAMGGVEADCEVYLRMQCGASGVVELSRTRNLRNSWIFCGERGTLEVGMGTDPLIRLKTRDTDLVLAGHAMRDEPGDKKIQDAFRHQLDDFADAIRSRREPFVSGQEGKRSVELIETCYAVRQPLDQRWLFPEELGHGVLEGATP